jgi:hypothetical protein
MPEDAIIMSWSVTEEGVCGNTFIPAMDLVGRKTDLKCFSIGSLTEARANWVVDAMVFLMRSTGTQPKKGRKSSRSGSATVTVCATVRV